MELEFRQSELWDPCLRHWALQYRKQLKRIRERPSKAQTGTLVHKGLEHYYLGEDPYGPMDSLWEVGALTIQDKPDWLKEYKKQQVLARVMVKGYIEWVAQTGADVGWEIKAVERRITAPFGQFEVPDIGTVSVTITGQADLEIVDEFDMARLVDHKTRDSLKVGAHDSLDQQRQTYSVLRLMEDGTFYRGAIHNVLRRVLRTSAAKPPFYGRNELHFSLDQLRKHYRKMQVKVQRLVPLAAAIEAGTLDLDDPRLETHVHLDCDWACPFIDVCPMMDDGSDWGWALNEAFEASGILEIDGEES